MISLADKIYVLTIESNFERHPAVQSLFSNMAFDFWYGFDAKSNFPGTVHVTQIDDSFFLVNDIDKKHVSKYTMGQFGAYFSIKKIIDHAAANNYKSVLICEDDLTPVQKDWRNILQLGLAELPADWDVLLAGYIYDGALYKLSYKRQLRFIVKGYNLIKHLSKRKNTIRDLPKKFSRHLDIAGYSTGGHAFFLSEKGAKLFSSYLTPMQNSGDILISQLIKEKKIEAYSVYPCLFLQDSKFASKTKVL